MVLPRGPLARALIILWCVVGMYTFTADGLILSQHLAEDVIQLATETSAVDAGEQTGTAEIRIPHVSTTAIALRNPAYSERVAACLIKCTIKPRRISHIEYCGKKMVRAIMLQFHPRQVIISLNFIKS